MVAALNVTELLAIALAVDGPNVAGRGPGSSPNLDKADQAQMYSSMSPLVHPIKSGSVMSPKYAAASCSVSGRLGCARPDRSTRSEPSGGVLASISFKVYASTLSSSRPGSPGLE